jgi:alkylhydroperoxidase/carboxymuconolactone decarboxylase family protein YurZ
MRCEEKNGSQQDDFRNQLANTLGADVGRLCAYFNLFENTFVQGALTTKVKRLIALAMAIGERNPETVSYSVHEAMDAGASGQEISEVVTVAVLLAGIPSLLAGLEASASVRQTEAARMLSASEPSNADICTV